MKVVFACAGTGGHVNPAIAIANIIKKNNQDAQILFIGTEFGLENKLVKNAGYKIKHISTGKIIRSFTLKNIKAVTENVKGIKSKPHVQTSCLELRIHFSTKTFTNGRSASFP